MHNFTLNLCCALLDPLEFSLVSLAFYNLLFNRFTYTTTTAIKINNKGGNIRELTDDDVSSRVYLLPSTLGTETPLHGTMMISNDGERERARAAYTPAHTEPAWIPPVSVELRYKRAESEKMFFFSV